MDPSSAEPSPVPQPPEPPPLRQRVRRWLVGRPRSVEDPGVFHHVSLVAFLAWVGLGADGLSSSSYGPEEAFKALGEHTWRSRRSWRWRRRSPSSSSPPPTRGSSSTSRSAAAATSSPPSCSARGAGVVSGCALLVDYVLTITISVAGGADAIFSFVPPGAGTSWKLPVEFLAIARAGGAEPARRQGVGDVLAPIFLVFLVTHVVLIGGVGLARRRRGATSSRDEVQQRALRRAWRRSGWAGCWPSSCAPTRWAAARTPASRRSRNGLQIMREPKVETGQRTMV